MKYTFCVKTSFLLLLLAGCSSSVTTTSTSGDVPTTIATVADESVGTTVVESPQLTTTTAAKQSTAKFALSSPDMADGTMPIAFTCDGNSQSPSLTWTTGPTGTVGYAIVMHHSPGPGDTHWYWVVYNIPATTLSVAAGQASIGTLGTNSVNANPAYAPPCSKGPGSKIYTLSVYALSSTPTFASGTKVTRDVLLAAIGDITLASSSIDVTYERS